VQSQFKSDSGPAELDQKGHHKAAMSGPLKSSHLALICESEQKSFDFVSLEFRV
jgi:hypothetical protein